MTRFLLLSDNCGFVDVGRSLWREDGYVVCSCCWPSPGTRDHILLSQIRDFSSRRLLRFAGLRWRYSTSPPHRIFTPSKVKVKVTLRLTVGQSLSLGVESHLGLMTRYLLLFDSYGLVFVGRPLWREDGSVFCICCWSSPAQSLSGPILLGVATIFHCLSFENSHFVASYHSQGHGGGIQPRLHTGPLPRIHYFTTFINARRPA
jgi:hypothetical protein